MFRDELRDHLAQGDVFRAVPIEERSGGYESQWTGRVMVLSHDCEIAKDECRAPLVARIQERANIDDGLWGHIRSNRVYQGMHLQEGEDVDPGFVDFRFMHRVRIEVLRDAERVAALTDEAREALAAYLWRFFTREDPTACD